ncbi:hypothetical protein QJS66_18365 [Kocuria rhizophila]|nr:hypothetical protein QJS66_18365 [Kocuria rhizophila]
MVPALRAGASGYLVKDARHDDIVGRDPDPRRRSPSRPWRTPWPTTCWATSPCPPCGGTRPRGP